MPAGGTSLVLEGILAGFPGLVGGDDGGLSAGVAGACSGGFAVMAKGHMCPCVGWGSGHYTVAVLFHHVDCRVCATASSLVADDTSRRLAAGLVVSARRGMSGIAWCHATDAAAAPRYCAANAAMVVGAHPSTRASVSHPLPHCMLRRSRQCCTSSVTVAVVVQHIDGIVAGTASGVRGVAGSPTTAAAAAAQACLASFPRAVGARLSTSASPQAAAATGVSTTSTTRSRRGVSS